MLSKCVALATGVALVLGFPAGAATITAFDVARGTVTVTGPQGRSQTMKAQNPADLEHIRVGDLVEITFSEVRALAVRAVDKR